MRGFTLIELMLVVVIVAVLTAIAVPWYGGHVLRTHRSVAKNVLSQLAASQESYFADRKHYCATLTELGYAADTMYLRPSGDLVSGSTGAIYSIAIASGATAFGYRLIAVPVNRQTQDARCDTLSITHSGARSASGSDGQTCWSR